LLLFGLDPPQEFGGDLGGESDLAKRNKYRLLVSERARARTRAK